jgi:excisionase family DNA binding protein
MEDIYTTKQVAGLLQVSVITIRRYIKSGKLKASKIGKNYRIKESDIESLLEKTRTK